MNSTEIKAIIKEQLPTIIAEDSSIRDFLLRTISEYYHPKTEVDSKFDRILAELQRDREEQARKWEENKRQWDENTRRLDEFIHDQNQKWKVLNFTHPKVSIYLNVQRRLPLKSESLV